MLLIRGRAGGTALTGTLYERGDRVPSFKGAPDEDADVQGETPGEAGAE